MPAMETAAPSLGLRLLPCAVRDRADITPRERIRQIEAKALRKLKHPSRSRILRTFLDN
jgi:hypothetical protein